MASRPVFFCSASLSLSLSERNVIVVTAIAIYARGKFKLNPNYAHPAGLQHNIQLSKHSMARVHYEIYTLQSSTSNACLTFWAQTIMHL